jgi:type IV secretion system protein VirD4
VVVFLRRLRAEVFAKGGMISASGGFIAIAVAIGMSVWRAREKARRPTARPAGPERTR